MKKEKEIRRISNIIIKKHKPEKIFLFGSFAWGNPNRDSDIDFLIIKKTSGSARKLAQDIDETLFYRKMPLDILVYSPSYFKKRLTMGDFFAQKIIKQGKLLYESKK